jgi:site-specific recombinase XerD
VPFAGFGKRHLDRYLVDRKNGGKSQTTLYYDAICAKAFFTWCVKNDLLDRSRLAEYQVRNAPQPHRYMPSDEDVQTLIRTIHDYWNVAKNPNVRYYDVKKRLFHRERKITKPYPKEAL